MFYSSFSSFLPLLRQMKLYFRTLVPLFFVVLCYSILTCIYGEKGMLTQEELKRQVKEMQEHIESLQEQELFLHNKVSNLSYDYDSIKVCANELGFLKDGELMIKLADYKAEENHSFSPGKHLILGKIAYMPDHLIKTISVSFGLLIVLAQMLIHYRRQGIV